MEVGPGDGTLIGDALRAARLAPRGALVALELMLLSLGRAQAHIGSSNDEAKRTMETLRREWSEAFRVQLTA